MIDQNSQFFAILTKVGEAKLTNATALGMPWKLTQMGVGDANGTDPIPDRLQTQLINEHRRAPLNQLKPDPADLSVVIAEQVIPADVGGWWVRELGLYDEDGDLVAVANCAPSYKPVLNQGSGRTQIVRMNFVVSSIANIVLKIDPAIVLATREYVDQSLEAVLPGNKTPGTYRQVTINKYGVVESGSNPDTLAGSGIKDGVTKTEFANAVGKLLPLTGGTMSGSIILANGDNDTPEIGWKSPGCEVNMDVLDSKVRISATYGGEFLVPLLLNIPGRSASIFGYGLWTTGNFDPSTKADRGTTLAAYGILDALSVNGTAVSAQKLATARTFTFGGAATGSASFDGSVNISISLTLADIGVVSGTYTKVQINSKGLVIGSSVLIQSDIPNLDWSKITSGKPTTSGGYGITDVLNLSAKATQADIESAASVNKWIDPAGAFLATQDVLCGMIFFHASSAPPPGSLKANGAWVSRTTYAKLFGRIGTFYGPGDGVTSFTLPDLRGEFIRGWDDNRGINFNRAFGSLELDEFKSHGHGMSASNDWTYNAVATANTKPFKEGTGSYQTGATGGSETRPRNVALLACIKY